MHRFLHTLFLLTNRVILMICLDPVHSLRIIQTPADSACRPNAFTYCEVPVITSLSEEPYPAFPGEEFRLPCQAYGSPPPTIAWFRMLPNGESIELPTGSEGLHVMNDAGTLRIRHIVPHDEGRFFCRATNLVGEAKALVEIKVSHPLVVLIPLTIGDSFVKLTWNGTVDIYQKESERTTRSDKRHHHHIEARYRLSRHLLLKHRRYKDQAADSPVTTTTIKLSAYAKHYTVSHLTPNTPYEFCIEFQPTDRPTTLLDCLILRTLPDVEYEISSMGYHEGHTVLFLLLMVIVCSGSFMCFGCYAMAIGKKLWKYRNRRGFSSLGYDQERETVSSSSDEVAAGYEWNFMDDNPKRPLIATI